MKLLRTLLIAACAAAASVAHAAFPDKTITIVVPYAPGGAADAIAAVLKEDEVQKRFGDLGAQPVGSTPAAFADFLHKEAAKWSGVVKKGNIKVD